MQKSPKKSDVFLRKMFEKYSQLFSKIFSQIFFDLGQKWLIYMILVVHGCLKWLFIDFFLKNVTFYFTKKLETRCK